MPVFPVLIVQCAQPGLLYVNGAFCGELSEPQMLPVRPEGRVYVEFRALEGPAFPLAVALELREGRLVGAPPSSAYAVQWPDRVIELELRPVLLPKAPAPREPMATLPLGAVALHHQRLGGEEAICAGDTPLFGVPAGTHGLRLQSAPEGALLLGEHPGGASAWLIDTGDAAMPVLADQAHAQQIALEGDGTLRALSYAHDAVGHAHLTIYRPQQRRLERLSRQHAWMPGAPHWPQTGQETLRAYLDALRVGAAEEAAAYLTPSAAGALASAPLPAFHSVVALQRPLLAPPADHPLALGLLEALAPNLGTVRAVCARAVAQQHAQGRYLLEAVALVE